MNTSSVVKVSYIKLLILVTFYDIEARKVLVIAPITNISLVIIILLR